LTVPELEVIVLIWQGKTNQIGYGCDSSGGYSDSAITRASDGKMIGLHHYGSVTPELNSATMMVLICQDAGEQLICDSD
jgi:hypothetical protein